MSPLDKIQAGFFEHLGTAAALVVTGLIGWLSLQIAPIIAPAIETGLPIRVLLGILGLSVFLNVCAVLAIYKLRSGSSALSLKYGIYWDKKKNPHCPSCKIPIGGYNSYSSGKGYYCKPCGKIFGLQDASGTDIAPAQAISEL
jgi:hypothetical protein